MFPRRLTCLLLVTAVAGCKSSERPNIAATQPSGKKAPVILVSIDGFRPDYLQLGRTPNLDALGRAGVLADGMRPSFPSITFPNHYTLVTGLRPDRNGMVGNTMEDRRIPGVRFSLGNKRAVADKRWWDEAEPIWVTAERANVRTATMFWPGSDAAIKGVRPTDWRPFDGKVPAEKRVDTVLEWMARPASTRPQFVTIYFDDVDHAGHHAGPAAAETADAVAHVDAAIGKLTAGLKDRGIDANIVVVSDHGMAETRPDRVVRLESIAPASSYRLITAGAYAGLEPVLGQEAALATALLKPNPHMQCWRKGQLPARFHYGRNLRVPAFVCLAEVGWSITAGAPRKAEGAGGSHGYDPASFEMRATFLAAGPAFKPNTIVPVFDNVDVYPLLMHLIGLRSRGTDGTIRPLLPGLK